MIQYNLTNSNSTSDLTTTKTVAAGSQSFNIPITLYASISLQLVYDDTDANDDTWKLYGSDDGINYYIYPNASTITSTITATAVTDGWQTECFKSAYLRVSFAKGSSTTGTYKLILTVKED
jgi:hypothetical protein